MFICGKDEKAKNEEKSIVDKFGFETEDMGGVEAASAIEPLAILCAYRVSDKTNGIMPLN